MGLYLRKISPIGPSRFNLTQRVGVSLGIKGLRVGSRPRDTFDLISRSGPTPYFADAMQALARIRPAELKA